MLTSHHGSHAGLLTCFDAFEDASGDLDAIIVPTVRPAEQLRPALEVSSKLNCPLLCLSSRESNPGEIIRIAGDVGAEVIVIDTKNVLAKLLPELATTRLVTDRGFGRGTDLSGKRNLGLLISQAMGWRKILFLDDDIRQLKTHHIRALAELLEDFDAVGLGNDGHPDNSVVCHAYREVDGPQDTFVSGGLLSVRADLLDGFFPDIYNEDWFFLHSANKIAKVGAAYQDRYDPFEFPQRARDEELGDCLAEGFYWLRDEKLPPVTAHNEWFWDQRLADRRQLIDEVVRLLETEWKGEDYERDKRLASLKAARAVHENIDSSLCTAFIKAWESDLTEWRAHRDHGARAKTVEDCLRALERRHSASDQIVWKDRVHRSG